MLTGLVLIALAALSQGSGSSSGGVCQPSWLPTFGAPDELNGSVAALTVFDDGSGGGPALYAGGHFTVAGGGLANCIARWDGTSWSPLGNGMFQFPVNSAQVAALAVFDEGGGAGPTLFAAGRFTSADGVEALNIARWDGGSWSPVGDGLDALVTALGVFDDGSGAALYAGGFFTNAGDVSARRIAKWDGTSWSSVGGGMQGGAQGVFDLQVFDDGSGPALYAGGYFFGAGGVSANGIASWNGTTWSHLGFGMNGMVLALTLFNDHTNTGPALLAGGEFTNTFDSGDAFLARWQGCDSFPPVLSCPASIVAIDAFSGPPGEVVTFSVPVSDDSDPDPSVVCVPASGSFFPRGTTLVTCTATDAAGNQSTCQFPLTVQLKARRR